MLDFSYESRIMKRAKFFDLNIESYLELMDVLEDNAFWVEEVKAFQND